jgi:FdhD protein
MARSRTAQVLVHRYRRDDAGRPRRAPDELIVEEPLEVHLDATLVATTMRTPGHDFELAVGLCTTDGLLAGAPVLGARYCATGSAVDTAFNVVTVETGGVAPVPTTRLTTTTSACGMCGTTALDDLVGRLEPLPPDPGGPFPLDVLADVVERVRADQPLFAATGAVHAAAVVARHGRVLLVREDIGRHNAVDKVVGRLALDGGLPATGVALFVSGRASYEIVQKAWAAGITTVVAVSAPSSLAVAAARRAGMTLAGFVRGDRMNVYAPEELLP